MTRSTRHTATKRKKYKKSEAQAAKEALLHSGLIGQDVSAILKEAQALGGIVRVTKEGIVVDFGKRGAKPAPSAAPPAAASEVQSEAPAAAPPALTEADPGGPSPEAPKDLMTPSDLDAMREAQRAQTLIDDPLQFEQDAVDEMLHGENVSGETPVDQRAESVVPGG